MKSERMSEPESQSKIDVKSDRYFDGEIEDYQEDREKKEWKEKEMITMKESEKRAD
jgi:hypothetical protein